MRVGKTAKHKTVTALLSELQNFSAVWWKCKPRICSGSVKILFSHLLWKCAINDLCKATDRSQAWFNTLPPVEPVSLLQSNSAGHPPVLLCASLGPSHKYALVGSEPPRQITRMSSVAVGYKSLIITIMPVCIWAAFRGQSFIVIFFNK